jgi:hypothetical protein
VKEEWLSQAKFSKKKLVNLLKTRFGDQRTNDYMPRLEKLWKETTEKSRRMSIVAGTRGKFFEYFDSSDEGKNFIH